MLRPLTCSLMVLESNMAIKEVEKRFDTIAVEKGFITIDQLLEALKIEVREDLGG